MYYGLQAAGIPAGIAGNYVQLFVVLGLCIGWIGSYIFRVANKVSHAQSYFMQDERRSLLYVSSLP